MILLVYRMQILDMWDGDTSTASSLTITGNALHFMNGFDEVVSDTPIISSFTTLEKKITESTKFSTGDIGKMHVGKNSSPIILTVPNNATDAIPIGSTFGITQDDIGGITIVPETGVTIKTEFGFTLGGLYAVATLYKAETNVWRLFGSLQ